MQISARKYMFFILIMISITSFLPLVHQNLPFPFGSFRFFWGPTWFISLLLFKRKAFKSKIFILFFTYGILITAFQYLGILWHHSSTRQSRLFLEEIYFILTAISIFSYFENYKEYHYWNNFVKITLVFIGITGIMTIISSAIDPMYARMMTQSSSEFSITTQGQMFKRLGGGLYSYGLSIVLLLPGLIYVYKQTSISKRDKYILLFLIVLIYLVILRMQFFANIMSASILILLSLLGRKKIEVSVVVLLIFCAVIIIIPTQYYSNIFSFFTELFRTESQNYYKMTDMYDFIASGELDEQSATGSRAYRYVTLFKDFKKNPVFGYLSYSASGLDLSGFHLHFMWKLTLYGAIMFVYYIYIHYYYVKNQLHLLRKNPYTIYFLIAIFGYMLLGSMKTVIGRDFWITYFVLLPGFKYLKIKPYFN